MRFKRPVAHPSDGRVLTMSAIPCLTGIGSLPQGEGSLEAALRSAVTIQRDHGFGLLTDGEPRGDMLAYYAGLPGIEMKAGTPRITGRIRPLEDPSAFVKVRDLDSVRNTFPDLAFKVALTAPSTFVLAAAASGAGPAYRGPMDPKLYDDLTEALRPIAHEIARRGAYLQLDDPILSQGMSDYRPALRRIDAIASESPRERASLHVCGGLGRSKALDALLRLESVSTLSLAFAGRQERENVGLIASAAWMDRDFTLGVGAIDVQVSTEQEIMPPSAVASLLGEVRSRVVAECLRYVSPDCGLRATATELVPKILANLRDGYALAFCSPT